MVVELPVGIPLNEGRLGAVPSVGRRC